MKQQLFTAILLFFCVACTDIENVVETNQEVLILGNQVSNMNADSANSRGITTSLNTGTQLSFYASKGIKSNGQILTYANGYWKGDNPLHWENQQSTVDVCAYTPTLPNEINELYTSGGQLKDILIAQQTFTAGSPIALHFEHFFTQVVFHLDTRLNQQLQELTLTPQQILASIKPFEGTITTSPNINKQGTKYKPNATGSYSLLLPPENGQAIKIKIKTKNNKIHQKTVPLSNCLRNRCYAFHVKGKGTTIGINNAEDFIAFTNLINGTKYANRSLDEFGITSQGITTYYLNNDICFTDEESNRIRLIGSQSSKGFQQIFDGQGYTLKNLSLKEERSTSYSGLFSVIGSTGTVKNLIIDQSSTNFKKSGGESGILCGNNFGTIINCTVKNSQITIYKRLTGGISGVNNGDIINCNVQNLKFAMAPGKEKEAELIGGITSINTTEGRILNSFATYLTEVKGKHNSQYRSCITSKNDGMVSNCASYQCSNIFHPYCYMCLKPCDHCYFPNDIIKYPMGENEMSSNDKHNYWIRAFYPTTEGIKTLVRVLNEWVDGQGKNLYPTIPFKHWKKTETNDIYFEME